MNGTQWRDRGMTPSLVVRIVVLIIGVVASVGDAEPVEPVERANGAAIHDVMPAFWRVWDATLHRETAVRVRAFRRFVLLPNEVVYGNPQFRSYAADSAAIAAYLGGLEPIAGQMRSMSTALRRDLPRNLATVAGQLPGLRLDRVTIYLLPAFDNAGEILSEDRRTIVLLGVDGLARIVPPPSVALDVAHIMFHLYQFQTRPASDFQDGSLWQATWTEGSAVYATTVLVPELTKSQALMSEPLARADRDTTRQLACRIQATERMKSRGTLELFLKSGFRPPDLPSRGSYLIGYLIARDLGKTRSLRELASIDSQGVRPLFDIRLGRLCSRGSL